MSQEETVVICSKCGAAMNHHAMKVDYSVADERDEAIYGGVLQEVHSCAHCGHAQLRQAQFI